MVNKWHLVQSFSQKNGLYLKMASGHADENVCYDVSGGVCENVLPDPLGFLVVLEEMGPVPKKREVSKLLLSLYLLYLVQQVKKICQLGR